jgi:hypothetical protein
MGTEGSFPTINLPGQNHSLPSSIELKNTLRIRSLPHISSLHDREKSKNH